MAEVSHGRRLCHDFSARLMLARRKISRATRARRRFIKWCPTRQAVHTTKGRFKLMRKLFMAALFIACAAPFTFAQTGDDYNKYDFGVLYSHNRVDTGFDDPTTSNFLGEREGFNGVEAFVKGNISRYVGLKGDYSFHRKSFTFDDGTAATTF